MKSIMDDVDKQVIVHKLIAGEATQEERDQALATVMLSLWGMAEIKDLIKTVHAEECSKCPFRKDEDSDASTWKKVALELLKCGGWLLAILAALHNVKLPC